MKTLDEILALDSEADKIYYLKQRRTKVPDVAKLQREWNPDLHDVMDTNKRPDAVVKVKEEGYDKNGRPTPAEYAKDNITPTNRIPLPLEQDIVNIHTAWTVGNDPDIICETEDNTEKNLLQVIKWVCRKNKMRYNNKRIVRSWLSEQEVAEYWYVVEDTSFWAKIANKLKQSIGVAPRYKLRCAIWSPFRGDKLYPFYDAKGDYVALSREYTVVDADGTETTYFMTVTDTMVYRWKMGASWEAEKPFKHGFSKNPTIYSYRETSLCHNITKIRERLEQLMSNFGDCIDRHFFPYLILEGDVKGTPQKSGKNRVIKITNGGKVYYLNWDQASEAVRLEMETLWSKAYQLTNTPQLSLEALKGLGSVPSGTAFKFLFMGTNIAVENHAEVIGEHIQRRYNFLATAIGDLNAAYYSASRTIDIETSIHPFSIDDIAEKIRNASDACGKPIASLRTGVMMAGLVSDVDDEVKMIEEENDKGNINNLLEPTY